MNEHRMSEAIAELAAALALAQGEFETVIASRSGRDGNRTYAYADLDAFLTACRAVLARHGLAVVQRPIPGEPNEVRLETILMHSSGQWIGSVLVLPVGQPNAKSIGSALTYARRYSLQAIVGLAATEDDDGKAAGQGGAPPTPAAAPKPSPAPAPASGMRLGAPAALSETTKADIVHAAQALSWPPERLREVLAQRGKERLGDLTEEEGRSLARALESKHLQLQAAAAF